jgi:hypothetical protein
MQIGNDKSGLAPVNFLFARQNDAAGWREGTQAHADKSSG